MMGMGRVRIGMGGQLWMLRRVFGRLGDTRQGRKVSIQYGEVGFV